MDLAGGVVRALPTNDSESPNSCFRLESTFGEFALGVNLSITYPMKDILYEEKIAGSLHLTPGNAYEGYSDNGNRSAIHWDLVLIQTPEWGGGEIWLDGVLVRKDGLFVPQELEGLNPERLRWLFTIPGA